MERIFLHTVQYVSFVPSAVQVAAVFVLVAGLWLPVAGILAVYVQPALLHVFVPVAPHVGFFVISSECPSAGMLSVCVHLEHFFVPATAHVAFFVICMECPSAAIVDVESTLLQTVQYVSFVPAAVQVAAVFVLVLGLWLPVAAILCV